MTSSPQANTPNRILINLLQVVIDFGEGGFNSAKRLGIHRNIYAQLVVKRGKHRNKRTSTCPGPHGRLRFNCGEYKEKVNARAATAQVALPFPPNSGFGSGAATIFKLIEAVDRVSTTPLETLVN